MCPCRTQHRCAPSVSIYEVPDSHLARFCLNECVRQSVAVCLNACDGLKCAKSLVFCSFGFECGDFIKAWLPSDTRKGIIFREVFRMSACTLLCLNSLLYCFFCPVRSYGSFFFPTHGHMLEVWRPGGMGSNPTPAMFSVLQCLCIWLPCIHLWPLVTITVKVELKTKHRPCSENSKALTDKLNERNCLKVAAEHAWNGCKV